MIERLRDVLGAIRCLYRAAPTGPPRRALEEAAVAVKSALGVAQTSRRDKELVVRLRAARRAILTAAEAVPWGSPVLHGGLQQLPGRRHATASAPVDEFEPSKPPFYQR